MATASFTKDFTLDTQMAVDSFTKIISISVAPARARKKTTKEDESRGKEKLRLMLSR